MTTSRAEFVSLDCPHCGQSFTVEVWLVVDTAERPDLADRCRDGTLHALACPHCGHQGQLDAPLLVYQPPEPPAGSEPAGGLPRLLFVPSAQTSSEEDQVLASALLALLREQLGAAWDDALARQVQPVPRELLPMFLSEDAAEREAARQEMDRATQEAMNQLRREDFEAYRQVELEATAQRTMRLVPLLHTLQEFIQARTWAGSRRVLEAHSDLLSDEADDILSQLIATAHEQEEGDTEQVLTEHRDLLRRCRVVGIERAFAEKLPSPASGREAGGEGLPPEAQAAQRMMMALTALPDDLRDDLVEVMANVSSPEELERALDARPELRAALERALEEQE